MTTLRIEDVHEGVRLLTIDRPDKRNALNHATYLAMVESLGEADVDPGVRVLIITGAQGNFTSGNDIADFRRTPRPEPRGGQLLFAALRATRTPVIAAVEGYAVGIGATMLLHCDLAYAGADSRFRFPFTALGLTPEGGSSYLLPRLGGDKKAAELLLLGEMFDAQPALEVGLINRVVASGDALAEATARACTLARLPAASVRATKELLRGHRDQGVQAALAAENAEFAERLASREAQEAFARFAAVS
ncbi:enoyl-CoA hydratase-related protein [Streptomyces sp. LHD-70]|uniref:enoyl-CoA hydratase/isomerase family protein n=1 Tax=Streptomyces sp. LHD-70 TaxID=3072140 RepID=UPI00280EAA02|nr:enoyl-CoA hydratase-related protein [Streptomyces sp. LHD-70]MDQ8701120.1 enoyl-CoA hydratase-related protein [Streptomyces sp. LHD-70]